MLRKNIYLSETQYETLSSFSVISISEHIRRAIDDYIVKITHQNATTSLSEQKAGENLNG